MLKAYIDGTCKPKNPGGTASWGVVVLVEDLQPEETHEPRVRHCLLTDGKFYHKVWESYGIVGSGPKMSNNVGEYAALLELLKWLDKNLPLEESVLVLSDSQMLVNQMSGDWMARLGKLYYPYYCQALGFLFEERRGEAATFKWVPREQNLAGALTVKALSEVGIVRRRRT